MTGATHQFLVETPLVTLAVKVANEAVTEIRLKGRARSGPTTPFERHVARELTEYAKGERSTFTFRIAPAGSPFHHTVWTELRRIPYGSTATYAEIATRLGNPHAARAVGQANHHNPIPIVIPCHRVVAAGGKLGGYGGGLDIKRRLLALEEAHSPAVS